ncbi:hypothetical protein, partial [Faecalibaculum rodentium]|uniref:hypothetical protein n=1 Tax=Faecalibaculum rodentium TaxID=1702221 RepID=UPI003EBDE2BE
MSHEGQCRHLPSLDVADRAATIGRKGTEPEIRVPVLYNEGMSRKIQRRRKPRRSVVIAAVAAGILLA